MIFKIFALLIILLFYSIYFSKMMIQKKQGIETRQIGKCKNKSVRTVEFLMSIATLLIVPVQLLSIMLDFNILNNDIRLIGFFVGI